MDQGLWVARGSGGQEGRLLMWQEGTCEVPRSVRAAGHSVAFPSYRLPSLETGRGDPSLAGPCVCCSLACTPTPPVHSEAPAPESQPAFPCPLISRAGGCDCQGSPCAVSHAAAGVTPALTDGREEGQLVCVHVQALPRSSPLPSQVAIVFSGHSMPGPGPVVTSVGKGPTQQKWNEIPWAEARRALLPSAELDRCPELPPAEPLGLRLSSPLRGQQSAGGTCPQAGRQPPGTLAFFGSWPCGLEWGPGWVEGAPA